jgi:enoyl-CoA hydratase/carnithine racemase
MAERIARVPPLAVQTAKRSLKQAYERMGFKEAQRAHRSLDARLLRADLPEKRRLMEVLKTQGLAAFLKARDSQVADG